MFVICSSCPFGTHRITRLPLCTTLDFVHSLGHVHRSGSACELLHKISSCTKINGICFKSHVNNACNTGTLQRLQDINRFPNQKVPARCQFTIKIMVKAFSLPTILYGISWYISLDAGICNIHTLREAARSCTRSYVPYIGIYKLTFSKQSQRDLLADLIFTRQVCTPCRPMLKSVGTS